MLHNTCSVLCGVEVRHTYIQFSSCFGLLRRRYGCVVASALHCMVAQAQATSSKQQAWNRILEMIAGDCLYLKHSSLRRHHIHLIHRIFASIQAASESSALTHAYAAPESFFVITSKF